MDTETPVRENEKILTDEEAAERAARKEAAREARKKKKKRKKVVKTVLLVVLLVIFVLVAAIAGFLLYLQGCTGEYDNITECVQSKPMDFSTRYAFSSADKTVSMKLDKNDIWWLLYQTGAIDQLEKMDAALSSAGVRLTGMGIDTSVDGSLGASAELSCLGSMKIPLAAYCGIKADESDININVTDVKLGNGWSLPLRWLCARFGVDPSALNIKISKDIHPYLEDLRSIDVTGGNVVVTFGANDAMLGGAMDNAPAVAELSRFGIESPAIASIVETASGAGSAAFETALNTFAADANAFADFRTSALALAPDAAATDYLTGPFAPYVQRFLPGLTLESVNSLRQELFGIGAERQKLLETLAGNLNAAYIKGTVTDIAPAPADDSKKKDSDKKKAEEEAAATTEPAANFLNTAVDGNPALTMEQIAGGNWAAYTEWITENDFKAVFLTGYPNTTVEVQAAEPAADKDAKKKDKDKSEEETAKSTVTTPAKPIGLLVRMKDGSFRLFYHEAALAEGSATNVNYTLTCIDLDSAAGESYMSQTVIPTVTYDTSMATAQPSVEPVAEGTAAQTAAEAPAA